MRIRRSALLALALAFLTGAAPPAAQPISREALPWWRERHQAKLAEAHARPVRLVWLGDSITQQWERPEYKPIWDRFYGDRAALNLGFKGDATAHLLWRLRDGEVDGLAPKAVVILIGANNLGRLRWPAPDDVAGIEAVVAEVRHRLPAAKLLLLGILPSDRGPWVASTAATVNRALAARYAPGREAGVDFVDLSPLFLSLDGRVDDSQFADGHLSPPEPALHPSPAAAGRMAAAIEPLLSAMLGDSRHGG